MFKSKFVTQRTPLNLTLTNNSIVLLLQGMQYCFIVVERFSFAQEQKHTHAHKSSNDLTFLFTLYFSQPKKKIVYSESYTTEHAALVLNWPT